MDSIENRAKARRRRIPDVPIKQASLLSTPALRSFWEFATSARRSQSLSSAESSKVRGSWLADDLVIQKIHGWGLYSVRLLCVQAQNETHRQRLELFFQRDRRNLESRVTTARDPLEVEQRVLVKIPYDTHLCKNIEHEVEVLHQLQGVEGVPQVWALYPIKDAGVLAAGFAFCNAPSLQQKLEEGRWMEPEELESTGSFIMRTLERVHEKGWLHLSLQAKDVLMPFKLTTAKSAPGSEEEPPSPLLCGWTTALPIAEVSEPECSLTMILEQMTSSTFDLSASVCTGLQLPPPSQFSAPEQLLSLFLGVPIQSTTTDVFRVATLLLVAATRKGPMGTPEEIADPEMVTAFEQLRAYCQGAVLERAKLRGGPITFGEEEVFHFREALDFLLSRTVDLDMVPAPELHLWFQSCLEKEPEHRLKTMEEACQIFERGWGVLQERLQRELKSQSCLLTTVESEAPASEGGGGASPSRRLVIEPPPELQHMHIL